MARPEAAKTDSRLAARCAATASVGAAVIHVGVAPVHWQDWIPAGLFFIAMALFQLIWAVFVWSRPTAWLLAAGILANGGSAALWVMSRTAGLPFGPHAGQPEAVDTAGICALLLQCYVVMGAAWAWMRSMEAHQVPALGRAAVLLGANTVMAGAVTVGIASLVQGGHHHHGAVEVQAEHPRQGAPATPAPAPQSAPVTDMSRADADTVRPETGVDQSPADVAPELSDGHHHDHN